MRRWIGFITTLIIAGGSATLSAQPANPAAADAPPMMAGRVAAVEGEVSIWRAEEAGGGQWDRAQINDIVTAGTGLATDNGRVEVRFGPHAVRLGEASTGGFSQLDFDARAFNLERGVVSVRLAPAREAETVTLTVADVRVDLAAPGRYRVEAIGDAPLAISVFDGHATVQYGGNAVNVGGGQTLNMTQSSMNFAVAQMSALDNWALARDARYEQVREAPRYVSPYMTGYEELDTYGDWVMEPAFGTVWVPRAVPIGWAPYRYGRWRWVAPWGWSWVDSAPWGYAPFHYGRWVTVGGRWCWWPGGYAAHPVWAPALVGFVGGGGTSVSVGFGGPVVGWYPLAPWHPYRPYYRANNTYVTVINQTIIQRPPNGVPPDINQRPGSTWVAGPRFREPIAKVHIPARTEAVAELRPAPPPPRPIVRTPAVAETGAAPGGRVAPTRPAPAVAQNSKFSAAPPQPMTGAATPTVSQPAPVNRIQPRPQPAPGQPPEREAPRAQPRVPQANANLPPYQQPQKPTPAESARTPAAAPPTSVQPVPGSAPRVVTAPSVFTSPPGYVTPPAYETAPARPKPPVHASPKVPAPAPVQAQGAAPPAAGATPAPGVAGNPHVPAHAPNARAQPAPQSTPPGALHEGQQQKSDDARAEQRGNKPPVDVPRAKTVAQ